MTGGGDARGYRSAVMPLYLNTWHAVVTLGENVERVREGSV